MWNMDNTNNSMVLMIEPYRVPSIACFAWFMACIDVVRGPCTYYSINIGAITLI